MTKPPSRSGIVKAILPKPSTSLHSLPSYAASRHVSRKYHPHTPTQHEGRENMKCAGIALLAVMFAWPVFAQDFSTGTFWRTAPTGYRGVAFGSSVADTTSKVPDLKCDQPNVIKSESSQSCSSTLAVTDKLNFSEHWLFRDSKLAMITIRFPYESADFVRSVFEDKYGMPTFIEKRTSGTWMLTWHNPSVELRFLQMDPNSARGAQSVVYLTFTPLPELYAAEGKF